MKSAFPVTVYREAIVELKVEGDRDDKETQDGNTKKHRLIEGGGSMGSQSIPSTCRHNASTKQRKPAAQMPH